MKVDFIVKYNQYESKRHFAQKMIEAFLRAGVEVQLFDKLDSTSSIRNILLSTESNFVCSFNRILGVPNEPYIWEEMQKPFISFLVDPIIYNMETVSTPKSLATCVDREDLRLAGSLGKNNILFMPHAVERELGSGDVDRIYPVVLIGSCYDPDNLKAFWRRHLPSLLCEVVEEAIENSFSDLRKTFVQATVEALNKRRLKVEDGIFKKLCYYVDNYMRGYDRIELVRSIRDVDVHIFGGTCWRPERPLAGWNHYFASQRNVVLHPAVDFEESLRILQQSKICLNSVLSVRDGSHERVLASYACGAMPISSDNLYWKEVFGSDIILYSYEGRKEVAGKIKELLADEPLRQALVGRGREKVYADHTWDNRVRLLLDMFVDKAGHFKHIDRIA